MCLCNKKEPKKLKCVFAIKKKKRNKNLSLL